MSKHETPMLLWYWDKVGGTLIEEFVAVKSSQTQQRRSIDGIIIQSKIKKRLKRCNDDDLRGKDIIVVQVKKKRLAMPVMGQTFFSMKLMKKFRPKSIKGVALCISDDEALRAVFEKEKGCKVVIYKSELN